MPSENQIRELLEQFLEQVLEPRIRGLVESGEIESQAEFDDALLPVAALQGTIDEWAADLKTALGYTSMASTHREDADRFSSPAERDAWVAEVCEQLDVTREQLANMDLDAVFRRIREL